MRFNLVHKMILLNVGIIVVLTSAFLSLSYFTSKSMYSNALNGIDHEVMRTLSAGLSEHYQQQGSWQVFIDNPAQWRETVDRTFFSVFFQLMAEVAKERGEGYPSGPPPGFQDMPKWDFPFGTFIQRLSLLDAQKKNVLIAPEIFNEAASYRAIKVEGKTVAWLRVGSINVDMLPLAQYFFDQQLRIVYLSAVIGGLFAVFLSVVLSRHITAPIKILTAKARQIAKRDFSGVVRVNTHDELQELAEGFNSISEELSLYQHRQKQWLMDVSHELKTPLTVLVAEVFAISDDLTKCDETTAELLQKEALRIKRIADDLYQLCQIDEMGIQLRSAPLRLPSLIKEQVISYRSRFDAKQIAVTEVYLADSPLVLADADRIAQVIGNLFENCLRYIQAPGKVWIREEMAADGLLIVVEDSGPGVPQEFLARLFDRLYRVESAGAGAGLGLAICKEIVQAHAGRITAKQSAHGGLRIEILLPCYENSL